MTSPQLKRPSEHLRTGMRERLRHLAVQRALRVIVPSAAVAADAAELRGVERERIAVIAHAADRRCTRARPRDIEAAKRRHGLPEQYLVWVGSLQHPDPAEAPLRTRRRAAANCRSCWSGRHARGRTS